MIIHGGEPPFIEKPEPEFGEVILKLDQMTYALEQRMNAFNESTQQELLLFSQNMAQFITDVVIPIDAHLNKIGPAHHETSKSIGLGKKDNYRTATLAEQRSLAPVLAYTTPQGSKQAFIDRNANAPFVKDDYQQNDLIQMGSYYYVNEFPTVTPTAVQGPRYLQSKLPVAMVLNDDRIVYSPASNRATYQTDVGFISAPTSTRKASRLNEIVNLQTRLLPGGWNNIGAITADGRVALFKPLADKKIFVFKDNLGLPAGARNFLLYNSFVGTVYKGLTVLPRIDTGTSFSVLQRFFSVNAFETDPTLTDLITPSYQALYTLMGRPSFSAPLQGEQAYDVRDFVTLSAGQNISIAAENGSPVISLALIWVTEDHELLLNVTVPVVVTGNGITKYMSLNFQVSMSPGTLVAGGNGTVTLQGTRVKDTINITGVPNAGSQYVFLTDTWNINCPSNLPGVVLDSGDVLRSLSGRTGIRIKRFRSGFPGLLAWLQGTRPRVDAKVAQTEFYAPSRYSPFGAVPERIIPITNLNGVTRYLVYGLDNEKGYYRWAELVWNSESLIGNVSGAQFGIKSPTSVIPYPGLDRFPRGLTVYTSKTSGGVGFNPLVFTTENNYKAHETFGYANGAVTLGAEVVLSPLTLLQLQANASEVLVRAKQVNPAIPDTVRSVQIQVYGLMLNKAVVVISDGISYAEGGAVPYSIVNGVFQLNFTGSSGIDFLRLTPSSNSVTGVNRESKSGDGVWSTPSDLLASRIDANTYDIVITRPFGTVYGDLSFRLGLLSSNIPVITVGGVNPARLYAGVMTIDAVDELHPPILLPNKGVYQVVPGEGTPMKEVGGTTTVDPYVINEAGWVTLPAGSKVVLLGRVYMLDRDYPIKVNPTGTSYCYLTRVGNNLVALATDTMREVNNGEVMFGTAVNGILTVNESYVVMDKHVLKSKRRGSAIPVFEDNGGLGVNQFFTRRDME